MILDNQLLFSNFQSLITDSDTGSTVIDMEGGVAENIGLMTRFGQDLGIGNGVGAPRVVGIVGTAFVTANVATLTVKFQGSTDSTTWDTYIETTALGASVLTANAKVFDFAWPQVPKGFSNPRYIRLLYDLPGSTSFTAGTIFAGVVLETDAQKYYGPAFSAA